MWLESLSGTVDKGMTLPALVSAIEVTTLLWVLMLLGGGCKYDNAIVIGMSHDSYYR